MNPNHLQLRPNQIPCELAWLEAAVDAVASNLRKLQSRVHFELGAEAAMVVCAHRCTICDRGVYGRLRDIIRKERISGEEALRKLIEEYEQWMAQQSDAWLRHRISDIRDVGQRLRVHLSNAFRGEVSLLARPLVVVVAEMLLSQIFALADRATTAIVTATGSQTSHAAIKELVAKLTRLMAEKLFAEALQLRKMAEVRQLAHRFIENVAPDLDPLVV